MSIRLPNARLAVRPRAEGALDSHGMRTRSGWGPVTADLAPGRASERSDGGWNLAVEPDFWPVREGDLVVSPDGRSWVVRTAEILRNHRPGSRIDWVRIDAAQRTSEGTEPSDSWMVGRTYPSVDDGDVATGQPPVREDDDAWTGHGTPPPRGSEWNPNPGDEYLDLDTGIIYLLEGA